MKAVVGLGRILKFEGWDDDPFRNSQIQLQPQQGLLGFLGIYRTTKEKVRGVIGVETGGVINHIFEIFKLQAPPN